MCGIAGFFLPQGRAGRPEIEAMCDRIVHRGPDDAGYFVEDGCALGMRRLSIIDLAGGHQPIANEDGRIQVVFNGEIYNYRELRDFLCSRGHVFRTHSDTETLVHLYEEEGPDGVARLRGMFAYAIWDGRERRLLVVRDRFGKKPLYYASLPEGLYFASEIKSLQAVGLPLTLDREALRFYFQFGYIPDPWSPFEQVKKLGGGEWLSYDGRAELRKGRYWKLPPPAAEIPAGWSEAEARDELRALVDEAVRIRMIADVPLGAFLSGGVDSSTVVSSMALASAAPVKTFSIGFREAEFNELAHARQVAERYHTEHHEILVEPDAVRLVETMVRHFDEPFADMAAIPTLVMSEFAVQSVKVALSGDGGDELFGGYTRFATLAGTLRKFDRVPRPARRLLGWLAEALPYSAYGKNMLRVVAADTTLARYFEANYAPYSMRKSLLASSWMLPADSGFLLGALGDCFVPGSRDALAQAMYWEATANLTGDMLVKVDRMSMAASLEVRCPLLDHKLAEFAARLPHAWKIRGRQGKAILIDAMKDRFPPGFLERKKAGFLVPLGDWFRGPLRPLVEDCLSGGKLAARDIVSPRFLRYLVEEHQRGRRDNGYFLWMLLILEMWFREVEARTAPVAAGRIV